MATSKVNPSTKTGESIADCDATKSSVQNECGAAFERENLPFRSLWAGKPHKNADPKTLETGLRRGKLRRLWKETLKRREAMEKKETNLRERENVDC